MNRQFQPRVPEPSAFADDESGISRVEQRSHVHDVRCDCGSLLARRIENGIELKCRRCKRCVLLPLHLESLESGAWHLLR